MADVTGPISTLPGSIHRVPEGMECDDHTGRLATHRVQGETDSFGSEMIDMCDECFENYRKEIEAHQNDPHLCERCMYQKEGVKPTRDPEEGSCGRLYDMCPSCRSKMIEHFCGDEDY